MFFILFLSDKSTGDKNSVSVLSFKLVDYSADDNPFRIRQHLYSLLKLFKTFKLLLLPLLDYLPHVLLSDRRQQFQAVQARRYRSGDVEKSNKSFLVFRNYLSDDSLKLALCVVRQVHVLYAAAYVFDFISFVLPDVQAVADLHHNFFLYHNLKQVEEFVADCLHQRLGPPVHGLSVRKKIQYYCVIVFHWHANTSNAQMFFLTTSRIRSISSGVKFVYSLCSTTPNSSRSSGRKLAMATICLSRSRGTVFSSVTSFFIFSSSNSSNLFSSSSEFFCSNFSSASFSLCFSCSLASASVMTSSFCTFIFIVSKLSLSCL